MKKPTSSDVARAAGVSQAAEEMVLRCFEDPGISLLPQEKPQIVQDRDYILYAMGVLGKYYPDAAFSFLKEYTGS